MFDTMTVTKAAGGFLSVFLVFLLSDFGAKMIYGGSHGDEAAAYVIETDDQENAAIEETVDFATLLASADAAKGAKVFSKCKACHKVDGSDATGPHLDGVIGRDIGSVAGFGYSSVFTELSGVWTAEELNTFLTDVKSYAPGTKMTFAGLKKDTDRANLIAYLSGL